MMTLYDQMKPCCGRTVLRQPLTWATWLCALWVALAAAPALADEAPRLPRSLPSALHALLAPWRATLVVVDTTRGTRLVDGDGDPAARSSPCSTFKIFHALVGLETGVLTGLEHRYRWDGTVRERPSDNHDHTLRTAIRDSCVWYFQRLALALGEAREREFLRRAGYGNEDVSAGLTTFWLDSSLRISPNEQVAFLERISAPASGERGAPPFSARAIRQVRSALRIDETDSVLYGKTGSAPAGRLGWFVGWVERGNARYVFALRLQRRLPDGAPASGVNEARPLAIRILKGLGLH